MKVMFLKDVPKQGKRGEIKEVTEGFGRNFLLPKKLAVIATTGVLKEQADVRAAATRAKEREIKRGERVKKQLAGQIITTSMKASSTGTLYAGVGREVVFHLLQQQGYNVLESEVKLSHLIKQIGDHQLTVDLQGGGQCKFTLKILAH